jgi:hypothetical protein
VAISPPEVPPIATPGCQREDANTYPEHPSSRGRDDLAPHCYWPN